MAKYDYVEVNTVITTNNAQTINELNGRQGDSNREVHFWLKDGNANHNLTGQKVALLAKDADGKVKTASTMTSTGVPAVGKFSMLIPSFFYQAVGSMMEAFLQVSDTSNNKIISTIPITFFVLKNNVVISQSESKTYIDEVQGTIDEFNKRFDSARTAMNNYDSQITNLNTKLNNMLAQMTAKSWIAPGDNTTFTGSNTFTKTINGSINGNAATANSASYATTAGSVNDTSLARTNTANWFSARQGMIEANITRLYMPRNTSGMVILGNVGVYFTYNGAGVQVTMSGTAKSLTSSWDWVSTGQYLPSAVKAPVFPIYINMPTQSGVSGYSFRISFQLCIRIGTDGLISYQLLRTDTAYNAGVDDTWKVLSVDILNVFGSTYYGTIPAP